MSEPEYDCDDMLPILTECEQCKGYGAIIVPSRQFHSKWDTDPPEYYNEEEPCPTCKGTGKEEFVPGEAVTLEDLESIPLQPFQ